MKPLLQHQVDAVSFLRRRSWRGALFMEPGLGKTRIGFELARRARRTLVIAPLNPVEFVWPEQHALWGHDLSLCTIRGTPKERATMFFNRKPDIAVINYELLHWLYDEVCSRRRMPYELCILDESTYVKNGNSVAFRVLKALLPAFDAVVPMTGTPAENSLADIWGQLYMVDEGVALGRKIGVFRERYCRPIRQENYVKWEVSRPVELREHAAPLCFVRRAADCIDMPPLVFNDVYFKLSPYERKFYDSVMRKLIVQLPTPFSVKNKGVAFDKGRQITSGFVYDERRIAYPIGTSKVEQLQECIAEAYGQPLLVGFWFQGSKQLIRQALGANTPVIDRFTSRRDKAAILDRWALGEIPVLLGQIKTVALGLNMQSPDASVLFYDLPWSHGLHWQFLRRVWRQGQSTRVVVRRLIARATIDGYIAAVLAVKERNENDLMTTILERELI